MTRRARAKRVLGLTCGALGTFGVILGLSRSPIVPPVGGVEGWVIATMEGFILLLAGILITVFSFPRAAETTDIVPAMVAFASRAPRESLEPRGQMYRAPVATPMAAEARDPQSRKMSALDAQIRDLTRRINKAGVMRATGQLSDVGYARYVADLKRQRGELEASRVKLEFGGAAP